MSVEAVDENMDERELRALILWNLTNQLFQRFLPTKVSIFFFSFVFVFKWKGSCFLGKSSE